VGSGSNALTSLVAGLGAFLALIGLAAQRSEEESSRVVDRKVLGDHAATS
jgi:hypothetical protein